MILKNGKRLDGCSDTVPVGTLNPFLGSVAPYGYLICAGQLVSKTTYKELYEICGDSFGEGTATEFRLPDLRGKIITGYKEGDTTFGTLGGLIGELKHKHITSNHKLTIDEIPTHSHGISAVSNNHLYSGKSTWDTGDGNRTFKQNSFTYGNGPIHNGTSLLTAYEYSGTNGGYWVSDAGSDGNHNHGDTTESSNLQPSINMNWIVKAFLLMPNQSYVENSLNSESIINSLSAAKGKELNDRVEKLETYSYNEQRIGTWVNNKPLYQKTIYVPSLPGANTKQTYEHNIANVDVIWIDASATFMNHGNESDPVTWLHPDAVASIDFANNRGVSIDAATKTTFRINSAVDRTGSYAYVTLKYTKTTD